jgi:hypothetical protein
MNDDDERLRKNAFAADARRAGFNPMVSNPGWALCVLLGYWSFG